MVIVWSCRERERREKERDEWERQYERQSHSPSPNAKYGEFIPEPPTKKSPPLIEIQSYYSHYERTEARLFLWIELFLVFLVVIEFYRYTMW